MILPPASNPVVVHGFYLIAATPVVHGPYLQPVPNILGLHVFFLVPTNPIIHGYPCSHALSRLGGIRELLGLPEPLAACEHDYLIAASQLYEAEKELPLATSQHYKASSTSRQPAPSFTRFGAPRDVEEIKRERVPKKTQANTVRP